jgi:hypothetical protein
VITAASGPEAIEIVRTYQGDIHLLVTDVVTPGLILGRLILVAATPAPGARPGAG